MDATVAALQGAAITLEVEDEAARDESIQHCVLATANLAARLFHRFRLRVPDLSCAPHPLVTARRLNAAVREMLAVVNPEVAIEEDLAATSNPAARFGPGQRGDNGFCVELDGWNVWVQRDPPPATSLPRRQHGGAIMAAAAITVGQLLCRANPTIFGQPTPRITLNLLDYDDARNGLPDVPTLDLEDLHVVGVGSLGSSFLYALACLPDTGGAIHIVDMDQTRPENVPYYPLLAPNDVGRLKPEWAKTVFNGPRPGTTVHPHDVKVAEYAETYAGPPIRRMVIVPDNVPARLAAADLFPRVAITATAQRSEVTVYHCHFADTSCPYCPYVSTQLAEPRQLTIMRLTGLERERVLRLTARFVSGRPIPALNPPEQPDGAIETLAARDVAVLEKATRSEAGALAEWVGRYLEDFYREYMRLLYAEFPVGGENNRPEEMAIATLPLAHVSALAGAIVYSELLKEQVSDLHTAQYGKVTANAATGVVQKYPVGRDASHHCVCWQTRRQGWYLDLWPDAEPELARWTSVGGRIARFEPKPRP